MAQLPPDSQRATWSHSPSVAAPACPARARLPLPMTAPVKAIFATLTVDVVGLRCRPLIGALSPLFAPARSAVGFGLERSPGRRRRNGAGFTPRNRKRLLVLSVRWTGGSPASIQVVRRWQCPDRMELGADRTQ